MTTQIPKQHQQRFIDANPDKAILNWETRTGKSLAAVKWLEKRAGSKVIICLKQNKKEWQAYNTGATVYTKEEFKKVAHEIIPTTVVVDEAHTFASPLFVKGRSQLAEALYNLVQRSPGLHILLLTATPVKNDAWSLHTLLCYIGVYYPWKEWRDEFFELKKMPFLRFPAWFPRKRWREQIQQYLVRHTNIVCLRDIVADLPPATDEIIKVPVPPYVVPEDEVVTWAHEHQHEQQGKGKIVAGLGYKKLLIAVNYREQIDALEKELSPDKPVFVLDGRTKDADAVKRSAQEAEECYFIVQSSMLMAFDGYMFGALAFVSMSHSCVHFIQAIGRQRHMEHLRPIVHYFLIGGRWDKRIMDCVTNGRDFSPHFYG